MSAQLDAVVAGHLCLDIIPEIPPQPAGLAREDGVEILLKDLGEPHALVEVLRPDHIAHDGGRLSLGCPLRRLLRPEAGEVQLVTRSLLLKPGVDVDADEQVCLRLDGRPHPVCHRHPGISHPREAHRHILRILEIALHEGRNGQGDVLFHDLARQLHTVVRPPVGGVDDQHELPRRVLCRSARRQRDPQGRQDSRNNRDQHSDFHHAHRNSAIGSARSLQAGNLYRKASDVSTRTTRYRVSAFRLALRVINASPFDPISYRASSPASHRTHAPVRPPRRPSGA